jgi:hypothetical protein
MGIDDRKPLDTSQHTRRALLALAAMSPLAAACASERPQVQINLTRAPELPPPPPGTMPIGADGAVIRAGFDAVQRMTVPAFVEDGGPYNFVVDTGANHSVMASELAAELSLPSGGRAAIHGIAGIDPAETVTVKRITVGGLRSRRMRMPLLPRHYLGADGLLGVDVLSRRRVTLDFRTNRFSIAPSDTGLTADTRAIPTRLPRSALDPTLVVVPARQRFGQLTIVDAEVDGVPVTAFLDSGAETTVGNLALRDAVLTRQPGLRSQLLVVQLISVTGQTMAGEMSSIPPLRLGGLRIGNLSCVFADLHTFRIWDLLDRPAILVGVDVMRHFDSIELDFGRSLVTFRTPRLPVNGLVSPPAL